MTKAEHWNAALGWAEIDGYVYPPGYLELVEREIRGEITVEDMRKITNEYFAELVAAENAQTIAV
jgi:hypothetical protein